MSEVTFAESQVHFAVSEANAPLFLGINYGSNYLKIGFFDNVGRTQAFFASPNQAEHGPDVAMQYAGHAIKRAMELAQVPKEAIAAAGFSFASSVDPRTGLLRRPPNFPDWADFPIIAKLNECSGMDFTFFNDANAAAYGEFWIGAAQADQSVCLLLLDKGVGCGIISEGREIRGANGCGGEFGHMIVDPSPGARWCNCLRQGHLEAYASATGIAKRTLELIDVGLPSSLQERVSHDTDLYDIPKMVYEEADKGDSLATKIILDTAHFLGRGIVTLLHTVDPECVLIGGEMMFGGKGAKIGEMFINKIREEVSRLALPDIAKNLKLDFAQLGSFASFIGAAGLAREEYYMLSLSSGD